MMRVKATRTGYYNHKRIYEGEIFNLSEDKHFSKNWMINLSEPVANNENPVKENVTVQNNAATPRKSRPSNAPAKKIENASEDVI